MAQQTGRKLTSSLRFLGSLVSGVGTHHYLGTIAWRVAKGFPSCGYRVHLYPSPPVLRVWLACWHLPWVKRHPMPTASSCHVDCGCS